MRIILKVKPEQVKNKVRMSYEVTPQLCLYVNEIQDYKLNPTYWDTLTVPEQKAFNKDQQVILQAHKQNIGKEIGFLIESIDSEV